TDEAFCASLWEALSIGDELSFFETLTLAAFVAFRTASVDIAVLEVGLGGRLDATNVIPPPRVAALVSVALYHTDLLGDTLARIATEKAWIAKPGTELVVGALEPTADEATEKVATSIGARVIRAFNDQEANAFAKTADVGLLGAHQRFNA